MEKLAETAPDLKVVWNPVKPRRMCFHVEVGDKVLVSLMKLRYPYPELKRLDLDELVEQIRAAVGKTAGVSPSLDAKPKVLVEVLGSKMQGAAALPSVEIAKGELKAEDA